MSVFYSALIVLGFVLFPLLMAADGVRRIWIGFRTGAIRGFATGPVDPDRRTRPLAYWFVTVSLSLQSAVLVGIAMLVATILLRGGR